VRAGWGFIKTKLAEYGILLSRFAIMLFFEVVTDGTCCAAQPHQSGAAEQYIRDNGDRHDGCVIVTGHIDLSVGSVARLVGGIAAVLMVRYDGIIPATIACLFRARCAASERRRPTGGLFTIPSHVMLAGMLVFRGGSCGTKGSRRPVLADLPENLLRYSRTVPGAGRSTHVALIGAAPGVGLVYAAFKTRARRQAMASMVEPGASLPLQDMRSVRRGIYFYLLIASHRGRPSAGIMTP